MGFGGGGGGQWGGGGGGTGGLGAPGNWACPDCRNENWPNRVSCNRCGRPRGEPAQEFMQQQAPLVQQAPPTRLLTEPAEITPSKVPVGPNGESSIQFLQMICDHNKWALDFTALQHISAHSGGVPMYAFKASIQLPAADGAQPDAPREYLPAMLYSTQEEAHQAAALHTLKEMGIVK